MKILVKNPVKGGTPAIENKDTDNKNNEEEFKLNPENALNVLLAVIKTPETTQNISISVRL